MYSDTHSPGLVAFARALGRIRRPEETTAWRMCHLGNDTGAVKCVHACAYVSVSLYIWVVCKAGRDRVVTGVYFLFSVRGKERLGLGLCMLLLRVF